MSHATLLSLLLPPASYSPLQARLAAELGAEGAVLDCANASADQIANAVTPGVIPDLLPDWERVLGLPNAAALSDADRVRRIAAKLAETGGLSIPYFTRLAAAMGEPIHITEPRPTTVDALHAGDVLFGTGVHDVWLWQPQDGRWQETHTHAFACCGEARVDAPLYQRLDDWAGHGLRLSWSGAAEAGQPLADFGDEWLIALFEDLKPAWTWCGAWLAPGAPPGVPEAARWTEWLIAGDGTAGSALDCTFDDWRLPDGRWLGNPPATGSPHTQPVMAHLPELTAGTPLSHRIETWRT